jgi:hypothetical protein
MEVPLTRSFNSTKRLSGTIHLIKQRRQADASARRKLLLLSPFGRHALV